MAQVLLSVASGRALLLEEGVLTMFEADRPEHFTPRAHEVDAFMATGPLFVSDATSERLSAFEIEVATAKAVESVAALPRRVLGRRCPEMDATSRPEPGGRSS